MKNLILILAFGLTIRLLGLSWAINLPQNGDLLRYADWGRIAFLKGFNQTYQKSAISFGGEANNQPPGSLYPISISYYGHLKASVLINKITNTSAEQANIKSRGILYLFMRIPSLIAEILLTYLIYIFVKRKGGSHALLASSLFYLNPVLIYNSTFWGQMDAINNLFFVGALILAVSEKYVRSASSLAVSCMTKLSVLPLIPLYLFQYFKRYPSLRTIVLSFGCALTITILLILPISKEPLSWLLQFLSNSAGGELQRITSEAYNFWYAIFSYPLSSKVIPSEQLLFLGVPLSVFGYLLYLLFLAPLAFKMIKEKKMSIERTFVFFSLLALVSFLFLPKMHERYLYPFFPLMSVALGFSKKWVGIFISISAIHFLNLFISWDPGYVAFIPYFLFENDWTRWGLALALIGIFIVFYREVIFKKSNN